MKVDPIKKFRESRLAKVKVPYLVKPMKEPEFVEGYRVSSGIVIESALYEKYKNVKWSPPPLAQGLRNN